MTSSITVLHTIADLRPESGGPSRVLVDLADALGNRGSIQPVLIAQSLIGENTLPSANERVRRIIANTHSLTALRLGLPFRSALLKSIKSSSVALIHNHGIWLPVNCWAAHIARNTHIAIVTQPHGMLEPWALKHKGWKKRILMTLVQRKDLNAAKVLVATSLEEYKNIRRLGFCQPIAVIPNGVNLADVKCENSTARPHDIDNRTVLFLSRVHPIKGLVNLIHAWAKVAPLGWRLRIAGPDEGGHLQEVMALVRKLGIDRVVEYIGVVDGKRKLEEYRRSDLFVLPTYSENFGVVVTEALVHGVPVITTRGAPWGDLETYGCGWWVDIGVEPLVQALGAAMALSDKERRAMGARGREYAQRYAWDTIAKQTIEVYRWVLGHGPKPDCVRSD